MNLTGDELHKVTVNLDDNLTKEDPLSIAINAVLDLVKIPDLGGVLGSFGGLLPQNLIQTAADGVNTLLDAKSLKEVINTGIEQVSGLLEETITSKLNETISTATSLVETNAQAATSALESVVESSLSSVTTNADYLGATTDTFFNATNITGSDLTSITNIQSAATSAINEVIGNLSPKQIANLSDPAFYQQIVNSALKAATSAISSSAIANAVAQVAPALGIDSMVKLAQAGVGLFSTDADGNQKPSEILAEINVYYGKGDGADSDAAQKKSVSGRSLQSGKSCAVDNSTIMIGSTVQTSVGTFTAVDKTKTASSNGVPVVDLFFETREEAAQIQLKLSQSKKKQQVVRVTPPGSGTYKPVEIKKRGTDYELY